MWGFNGKFNKSSKKIESLFYLNYTVMYCNSFARSNPVNIRFFHILKGNLPVNQSQMP